MKNAIQEYGSTKPDNLKLAQIVEQAKKMDISSTSIKCFLDKMESQKKLHEGIIDIRGPSGCIMLIRYLTDNMIQFQSTVKNIMKKSSGSIADSSVRNMFTHIGIITVEKKDTLEQATEDAINIGAKDVEEFEEKNKKYFQFTCDPEISPKIKNLLERRQYRVLSVVEDYVPHVVIKLSESDLENVSYIRKKIYHLDDIISIYDNIE